MNSRHLILLGGGHSHLFVLRKLRMEPLKDTLVTLVSDSAFAPYSGMLPGYIAGFYEPRELYFDLRKLAAAAGVRFVIDSAAGIDPAAKNVLFARRPPLNYDLLSVNVGAVPQGEKIPGQDRYGHPVKPIGVFESQVRAFIEGREPAGEARLVQIGGGAAGVECSLAVHARLRKKGIRAKMTIVERGPEILAEHNSSVRNRFRSIFFERGIDTIVSDVAVEIAEKSVALKSGRRVDSDFTMIATPARAPAWLANTGLKLDDGFLLVNEHLQSVSHADVFAAGDVCVLESRKLPRAGVFAVRQGPVLAENLYRKTRRERLRRYRPQRRFLSLLIDGEGGAVMSYDGLPALRGQAIWRWKDRIDRKFMMKFSPMPMTMTEIMRCTGCGAKVESSVLHEALQSLVVPSNPSIVMGLKSREDAAVSQPPPGRLHVQSVDFFPQFVSDPYLFGVIAAQHALSDLYAMGAEPHSALAMVSLPLAGEKIMASDLQSVLRGAVEALNAAGCTLSGGHTVETESDKISFGLVVNGYVKPKEILTKGGMKAGEHIILTKPIGTGTLLAAGLNAETPWLLDAFEHMKQGQATALPVLRKYGVRAVTDVTGFGLAGHLREMLLASKLSARLDLGKIPILEGSDLTILPHPSTLHRGNRKAVLVEGPPAEEIDPRFQLLFDPQTSGGLVFSIEPERSQECCRDLREAGFGSSAVIGVVETGESGLIRL